MAETETIETPAPRGPNYASAAERTGAYAGRFAQRQRELRERNDRISRARREESARKEERARTTGRVYEREASTPKRSRAFGLTLGDFLCCYCNAAFRSREEMLTHDAGCRARDRLFKDVEIMKRRQEHRSRP